MQTYLNRFLSASAWSYRTFPMKAVSKYSNKNILTSTCTFIFQNLSSHYAVGIRLLSCTCKEYGQDIQFLSTSPYYNPTTYTRCKSLRKFSTASHLTIIKKTSTNQILDGRNYFQSCQGNHSSLHVYCRSLSLSRIVST